MAFDGAPIVDDNARRSEASVNKVRSAFNLKNGFLSRSETPDYGVDLDVELIDADGSATSRKFPIQIKSTKSIQLVNDSGINYATLSFETSRLGYLCQRPPAYGLVVLYDEVSDTAYFDYVEEIVKRLNDQRGKDWQGQDTVRIHIPLTPLDDVSATAIHSKLSTRFVNHTKLIANHGTTYDIPALGSLPSDYIDFNDVTQVFDLLTKHGVNLLNDHAFGMLSDLIGKLPAHMVSNSKELLFLGAMTFGHIGPLVEGDYYISRCNRYWGEFGEEERISLTYLRGRSDFVKGNIDAAAFDQILSDLASRSNNIENKLTFESHAIYARFLNKYHADRVDESILNSIESLFDRIEGSTLPPRKKALLQIINAENLHNYGLDLLIRDGGKMLIQWKLKRPVAIQERLTRAEAIITILRIARTLTYRLYIEAKREDEKVVFALAGRYFVTFFFREQFQISLLTFGEKRGLNESNAKEYEASANLCSEAIDTFFKLGMVEDAYEGLITVFEVQLLCKLLTGIDIGPNPLLEVEKLIRDIEKKHDLPPFVSLVVDAFEKLSENPGSPSNWAKLPDNKIEWTGRRILEALDLPQDRLPNIVSEIRGLKTFYSECTNPDIELLTDCRHQRSPDTYYASAPVFILKSRTTGIETRPSEDIRVALDQFSTIIKKK